MTAHRPILSLAAALVATLFIAAACETAPPVQEMSDARQAIAAAQEAGAADLAAAELKQAEIFLRSAERKLNDREYAAARFDAVQAKEKALRALKMSEEAGDTTPD